MTLTRTVLLMIMLVGVMGFKPYAEGSKLYIGKNRLTDWIDVGCKYVRDTDGTCCVPCWCDESDIETIEERTPLVHYKEYRITKAKSVWILTYFSPDVTDVSMSLMTPLDIVERCKFD